MKARENLWEEKDELRAYLVRINRERRFFKKQLTFAIFLLLGIILFIALFIR